MSRVIVLLFVVVALSGSVTAQAGKPSGPPVSTLVAERIVLTWRCQEQLGVARTMPSKGVPWNLGRHSKAYRQWVLATWKGRHARCLNRLHERARQWNWQAWLPDKWRRVGICETGLNWFHANSSYVSAFGISVQSYDDDAAYMGVPGWPKTKWGTFDLTRAPSPWHQWQAALGHYKQHGGFSGWGCRGA